MGRRRFGPWAGASPRVWGSRTCGCRRTHPRIRHGIHSWDQEKEELRKNRIDDDKKDNANVNENGWKTRRVEGGKWGIDASCKRCLIVYCIHV
jgi:hypothetical protein